ncbi:MAG: hypothetical protein JJU22_02315 [Gammaproteobacteria bacterium]|nr:hypothetical protein [Gammaproteobacteria bacterium]
MTDDGSGLRQELLRGVRDNLRDGASHLARVALDALKTYALRAADDDVEALRDSLLTFAADLGATRPSMTAVHNLVARWQEGVAEFDGDLAALRNYAVQQAQEVRTWADAATDATVRAALQRIEVGNRILLHSSSSTVGRILQRLADGSFSAVVTEARPGLEGWNVAAALAGRGIEVTYITDAQAGIFIDDVDLVLFGADSVLADGALVNKVGSRLIALAAREAGVPVLVAAESFKCTGLSAQDVQLEEKSGSELRPPPVPGVRARNIYFDITPAGLISNYLSNEPIAERFVGPA